MIELFKKLEKVKTYTGLTKVLKESEVLDNSVCKRNSLYHITLGTHDRNIFVQLSFGEFQMIEITYRVFNGKNYDLYNSCRIILKRNGEIKLWDYLNNPN